MRKPQNAGRRLVLLVLGLVIIGFASSLMVNSGLGSDPFNLLAQGISIHTGLLVGTIANINQGILLIVLLLTARRHIGIGTVLGALIIGSTLNVCTSAFGQWLLDSHLGIRIAAVIIAPCVIGFGLALVQLARLGMAPNDNVPLAIFEHQHRFQYRTVRVAYDATLFTIGAIIGGTCGFGTIACVSLLGPSLQFWLRLIAARGSSTQLPT